MSGKRRPREGETPASDHSHALIRETLLDIARHREAVDVTGCEALFALIQTGRAVHRRLLEDFASHDLTEAKFCALTVLHRLDPDTITAADLAYHSGVSRSAMTDILDQLVAQGWVERRRAEDDRRTVRIGLNDAGRQVINRAIDSFMVATANVLDAFPGTAPRLVEFCAAVNQRLAGGAPAAPGLTPPRARD